MDTSGILTILNPVMETMRQLAYLFLTLGFIFLIMRAHEPRDYLLTIALAAASVALIATYPSLMESLVNGFREKAQTDRDQMKEIFTTLSAGIDQWKENNKQSWIPSAEEIKNWITIFLVEAIFHISSAARIIILAVQETIAKILIAFSPLMIGFILLGATRSLSITFLMLSLSVCLWPFSFVIGDILLVDNMTAIVSFAGIKGGFTAAALGASVATNILIIAGFMLLAIFLTYLLCPVFLSWLMSGVNPAPILAGLGLGAAGAAAGQIARITATNAADQTAQQANKPQTPNSSSAHNNLAANFSPSAQANAIKASNTPQGSFLSAPITTQEGSLAQSNSTGLAQPGDQKSGGGYSAKQISPATMAISKNGSNPVFVPGNLANDLDLIMGIGAIEKSRGNPTKGLI